MTNPTPKTIYPFIPDGNYQLRVESPTDPDAVLRVVPVGPDGVVGIATEYNGYAAEFRQGSSPLQLGSNVLRTSVDGIVPGTTDRTATDTDRVTFDLVP